MKVAKAVIPAAGFGTRVLPASKSIPKEMLPVVDRPAIHYIVEEAVRAGITDILIITSRGKGALEDYFDHSPDLEEHLRAGGASKEAIYREVTAVSEMADIHFLRQKVQNGLGGAVYCARTFVGNEPFAVLYGDDVIISPPDKPAIGELAAAYDKYGLGVVGIKPVSDELIVKYSSLAVEPLEDRIFRVTDMIEKPSLATKLSNYSILGRCVLPPEIFGLLEHTGPGAGGEIQLTDAMRSLAVASGMTGVDFTGKRYDMGSKLGIMQAAVEVALAHPEIGESFREYLKGIASGL